MRGSVVYYLAFWAFRLFTYIFQPSNFPVWQKDNLFLIGLMNASNYSFSGWICFRINECFPVLCSYFNTETKVLYWSENLSRGNLLGADKNLERRKFLHFIDAFDHLIVQLIVRLKNLITSAIINQQVQRNILGLLTDIYNQILGPVSWSPHSGFFVIYFIWFSEIARAH
jgi:hypothetical protein